MYDGFGYSNMSSTILHSCTRAYIYKGQQHKIVSYLPNDEAAYGRFALLLRAQIWMMLVDSISMYVYS